MRNIRLGRFKHVVDYDHLVNPIFLGGILETSYEVSWTPQKLENFQKFQQIEVRLRFSKIRIAIYLRIAGLTRSDYMGKILVIPFTMH